MINHNTAVVRIDQPGCSDCDPGCQDTITVEDAQYFQVGDRALIIQMKGASIDVSNTSTGGQITDIANAGNYEFFIVDSVDLTNDMIFPEYGLIKQYDEAGQVQVIRIPNYGKHPVTVTDTLTSPTWDESTGVGGVVALVASKLILSANIDVIGKGFKGNQMTVNGTPDNCTVTPSSAFTLPSTATQSYTKGEGIVADNTAYNRGRAPRANGGGSGISGDSGGGGGSSYGKGGIGGKRWCDQWGLEAGGLGGVSLSSYFLQDKLFLGGAGGSGYVTTNNPSDATDGGGIVILFVDTIVGNGYSILADGTSPVLVNPVGPLDDGGGGGGGGTVLLNVRSIEGNLDVSADGIMDHIDLDADGDLELDSLEGWDFNGDGLVDVLALGIDIDLDGLDDAYDDVLTNHPVNGATNGSQDAFDLANADGGADERDWREQPCVDGVVTLSSMSTETAATSFCASDGWTYFYDPLHDSLLLFAIEKYPEGAGANTADISLSVTLTVSIDPSSEAGLFKATDEGDGRATFVSGRYWNINILNGSLNGYVNARFYFAPNELDTLQAVAQRWNDAYASSTPMVSGVSWFATNSGSFDTTDILPEGVLNAFQLSTSLDSVSPGIQSATFSLSTLTGGAAAYTIGTNSVILAAEQIDFNAGVVHEDEVLAIWQTSLEVNTDQFFVEKSSRGSEWVYVGEVAAAGNSSTSRFYELLDPSPYRGTSYYRLHTIDLDGSVQTTDPVKVFISSSMNEPELLVYPNPNAGSFHVTLSSENGVEGELRLCTMQGSLIKNWTIGTSGTSTHQITISDLSKGHYLVLWQQKDKLLSTKIIVN